MIIDFLMGISTFCEKCELFSKGFFSKYEDDYNTRLIFVKLVYLFQSLTGISLGYNFIWHIDGPYSKLVNGIGYAFQKNGEEYSEEIKTKNIKFTDESVNRKIAAFYNKIKPFIQNPKDMELAASIEYIRREGISDNELVRELIEKKPKFRNDTQQIRVMINKLNAIRRELNS